jgi:hypothetical protein
MKRKCAQGSVRARFVGARRMWGMRCAPIAGILLEAQQFSLPLWLASDVAHLTCNRGKGIPMRCISNILLGYAERNGAQLFCSVRIGQGSNQNSQQNAQPLCTGRQQNRPGSVEGACVLTHKGVRVCLHCLWVAMGSGWRLQ